MLLMITPLCNFNWKWDIGHLLKGKMIAVWNDDMWICLPLSKQFV